MSSDQKPTQFYGVDFGAKKTTISTISDESCRIADNSFSQHSTPSCVAYNKKSFEFGYQAELQSTKLAEHYVNELKEYIGKYFIHDNVVYDENWKYKPTVARIEDHALCFNMGCSKCDNNCSEGYCCIELLFVLLMKYLKETMMKEGNEVIICHPCYYNEKQIEYINELYKVCEMKVLKNIPEYLSASLCFGYENNNKLNENEERIVLLLDMGYINCSSTIVKYKKNECEILSHSYNNDKIGGRYIDNLLVNALIGKMGMNIDNISEKLYVKVKEEIIKMKEKLSASGADTIHISIDDGDNDYESDYSVNELNEILKNNGINTKVIDIIKDSIVNSGLIEEEEDNKKLEIVIIGGSLRIPLIQKEIENYLKSELDNDINLNRTINMDECMSLGNSYYGLIQSGKWFYAIKGTEPVIHNINGEIEESGDCLNTNDRIKKIKESLDIIQTNQKNIAQCSSKLNDIESTIYSYQHLIEDNKDNEIRKSFKDYLDNTLKMITSDSYVDKYNYDQLDELDKEIHRRKDEYVKQQNEFAKKEMEDKKEKNESLAGLISEVIDSTDLGEEDMKKIGGFHDALLGKEPNKENTPTPTPIPTPTVTPQPIQPPLQQSQPIQQVANVRKSSPVKIVRPTRQNRPADPIAPYIRTGYTPPKQTIQVIRNTSPPQQQQQQQYLQTYVEKGKNIQPRRSNRSPLQRQNDSAKAYQTKPSVYIGKYTNEVKRPYYNINTPITAMHHSLTDINSLLMELSHYASDYPHYIAINEIHGLINEITRETIDERSYDRIYNTLHQEILAFRNYIMEYLKIRSGKVSQLQSLLNEMYYMISSDYLYQKIVQMIKPDVTHYPIDTYDKVIKELIGMRNTSRINQRLSDNFKEKKVSPPPPTQVRYSPTARPSISPKQLTPVVADSLIDFNDSIQPPYRSTRSSLSYSPSSEEKSFKRSGSNRSSLNNSYNNTLLSSNSNTQTPQMFRPSQGTKRSNSAPKSQRSITPSKKERPVFRSSSPTDRQFERLREFLYIRTHENDDKSNISTSFEKQPISNTSSNRKSPSFTNNNLSPYMQTVPPEILKIEHEQDDSDDEEFETNEVQINKLLAEVDYNSGRRASYITSLLPHP